MVSSKEVPKRVSENVVAYMIGGGSLYDYETVQELAAKRKNNVRVVIE